MDNELAEGVARAIALECDVDPDVFIGMHGRRAWEKQWHPQAQAALAATPLASLKAENAALLKRIGVLEGAFRMLIINCNDEGRRREISDEMCLAIEDATDALTKQGG